MLDWTASPVSDSDDPGGSVSSTGANKEEVKERRAGASFLVVGATNGFSIDSSVVAIALYALFSEYKPMDVEMYLPFGHDSLVLCGGQRTLTTASQRGACSF